VTTVKRGADTSRASIADIQDTLPTRPSGYLSLRMLGMYSGLPGSASDASHLRIAAAARRRADHVREPPAWA
jgi:hypothetical protein